jgi:2-oxoglutarate ferredoxin oxidoreductase subunit beta
MHAKNFASKQEINWCPGCGNYIILATVQRLLAEMGILKENIAFISGIGCSSRFVYYMDTYGFHTIHGRATAVAAGLKITRPELSVWVIIGDGDGLSIGLGHLLHLMRRNIDVNILLLNNQIYGLTKGQYSPTSKVGIISNSSPYGSIDKPFNPVTLALAAECSFVARTLDADPKHLSSIIQQAAVHKGTSFVEVLQNCLVFNEAFVAYKDPGFRQNNCIYLPSNAPIRFGKQLEHGLTYINQQISVVHEVAEQTNNTLLTHNPTMDTHLHFALAQLQPAEFPLVLGVFRDLQMQTYDAAIAYRKKQVQEQFSRSWKDVLLGYQRA